MVMVRIVSWNINSVRARLGLLEQLIKAENPDIICLQETKVQDHAFPTKAFKKLGYEFAAIKGQKSYHGVATLSRLPLESVKAIDWCNKGDARHIAVRCKGVAIHNFYVPAGGDVPDRKANEKFDHKLRFFDEMIEWASQYPTVEHSAQLFDTRQRKHGGIRIPTAYRFTPCFQFGIDAGIPITNLHRLFPSRRSTTISGTSPGLQVLILGYRS